MSARRWPLYRLEVGESYTVWNAPRRHKTTVYRYGTETGKRFCIRRLVDRVNPPLSIRRVA